MPQFETVIVPLAGSCDLSVGDQTFSCLGNRANVWVGKADSVYTGPNTDVVILARDDCEVAVAGGLWDRPMAPLRIRPEEVDALIRRAQKNQLSGAKHLLIEAPDRLSRQDSALLFSNGFRW